MPLDALLGAIQQGDAEAFARFVARAEAPLRRSLRGFARVVDSEAVLQEALLRLWQVAPRIEHDGRPDVLMRMAYRITRNLAISETRRRRPDLTDPAALAASAEARSPGLPDPLLRQMIARCREALPEKPKRALAARVDSAGGDDDATLAERLGMRVNTFLQNVTRARKALVDCLERGGVVISEVLS